VFARDFRTYAVDLPGFGANRATRWRGLDAAADWLSAWMDAKGLKRAHLAGHSLGGAVAARVAAEYPERVDRLVLVDAAVRAPRVRAPLRMGNVWHILGRRQPGFLPMLAHDVARMAPSSFVAALIEVLQRDWDEDLARITAPTLVLWGERDAIMPIAHGQRLAEAIPAARIVTLPDVGHNPMWECTEAFNDEVVGFLRGPRPRILSPNDGPHPPASSPIAMGEGELSPPVS
jgi:pimeloyl-ACP methyl ester carboxylesterase